MSFAVRDLCSAKSDNIVDSIVSVKQNNNNNLIHRKRIILIDYFWGFAQFVVFSIWELQYQSLNVELPIEQFLTIQKQKLDENSNLYD